MFRAEWVPAKCSFPEAITESIKNAEEWLFGMGAGTESALVHTCLRDLFGLVGMF